MICALCNQAPCGCGSFQQLTHQQLLGTLPQQLRPCIDEIRSLKTCFGVNVYSVRLIWIKWTGQIRGRGTPTIVHTVDILPNPSVSPLISQERGIEPIGVIEQGDIEVSEISLRYGEQELTGQLPDGSRITEDMEFLWEVGFPRADGSEKRRRFTIQAAPAYEPTKMQWRVSLQSADPARTPFGDPRE